MTMQLFRFQTNRLSFRPRALKTLFRPCSENTHLKATEKALKQNFWVQSTKHLYNSFSTARLRPTLNRAIFTGEPGKESQILSTPSQALPRPLAFIWLHWELCSCPVSSLVSVHFLQNRWPQQMCPSGISTFFFFFSFLSRASIYLNSFQNQLLLPNQRP